MPRPARDGEDPVRDRLGLGQPLRCVVIAIAEGTPPGGALEGAELEALERQCCDAADERLLDGGLDEVIAYSEARLALFADQRTNQAASFLAFP